MFITSLANKVTTGLDIEAINDVLELVPQLNVINEETKIILILIKISEHSSLIMILGVTFVIVFVLMLINLRRVNDNGQKKDNE